MKNTKLKLFEFKNELTFEQLDVAKVIERHLQTSDYMSEKEMFQSLNENLFPFTYYQNVKLFLENFGEEIQSQPLVMDLKDIYKKIERQNQGMVYRQPLITILEIINKQDDDARMESILNELSIYDWVPEIKKFMYGLSKNPIERQNLVNSGKANKIFTLVEKVDDGIMVFVQDRWFLIKENEISQVLVDDFIKDDEKIREIRILEQVMTLADIADDMIKFRIDENLNISISTKKGHDVYINDEKIDSDSSLESIFTSPIIPYLKKDYYHLLNTTKNNINKFVELDIAMKVSNMLKPQTESIIFNYKDNMYVYSKDQRSGSMFVKYESVNELIIDIRREFDCDVTSFYENKLSKEMKHYKALEEKEKAVELKIKDINESIDMLSENKELMEESKELKDTFDSLLLHKHELIKNLKEIKDQKNKIKK